MKLLLELTGGDGYSYEYDIQYSVDAPSKEDAEIELLAAYEERVALIESYKAKDAAISQKYPKMCDKRLIE